MVGNVQKKFRHGMREPDSGLSQRCDRAMRGGRLTPAGHKKYEMGPMEITSVKKVDCTKVAVALSFLPVAGSVQSAVVYRDLDPNLEVTVLSDSIEQGVLEILLSDLFPQYSEQFGQQAFQLSEGQFFDAGGDSNTPASMEFTTDILAAGYSSDAFPQEYPTNAVMGPETSSTKSFSVGTLEALNELPEEAMRGFFVRDASSSSDSIDENTEYLYGWLSYGFRNAGVRNPEAPADQQFYSVRPFISEVAFETTANTPITIGDKYGSTQNSVSEPMTLPLVAAGIAGIAAVRRRMAGQT